MSSRQSAQDLDLLGFLCARPLPCVRRIRIIEIKDHFGCWLMVEDAHGLGVLLKSGRGIAEYVSVNPKKIDILMGTLSKTLASCGGFIAGNDELIEILKYCAPGFVFLVGLPPAMTAAALAALGVIKREPARIQKLHKNCSLFYNQCRVRGLNTGVSIGLGVIPVIMGSVKRTGRLMERMTEKGVNASPIIYPGVPINSNRLRFFISSEHSTEEILFCAQTLGEEYA